MLPHSEIPNEISEIQCMARDVDTHVLLPTIHANLYAVNEFRALRLSMSMYVRKDADSPHKSYPLIENCVLLCVLR